MPFAGAGAGPPTRRTLRSLLGLRQHKRQIISAAPPQGDGKCASCSQPVQGFLPTAGHVGLGTETAHGARAAPGDPPAAGRTGCGVCPHPGDPSPLPGQALKSKLRSSTGTRGGFVCLGSASLPRSEGQQNKGGSCSPTAKVPGDRDRCGDSPAVLTLRTAASPPAPSWHWVQHTPQPQLSFDFIGKS